MTEAKRYVLSERTIDVYLQKSYKILFPLLLMADVNPKIRPLDTYLSWKDQVGISEYRLICLYQLRGDEKFKAFERDHIKANQFFERFIEMEENKGVYIFNLGHYKEDYEKFLKGQYSEFSEPVKTIILDHWKRNTASLEYIDSFLNPGLSFSRFQDDKDVKRTPGRIFSEESYYSRYAELLAMPEDYLRQHVELYAPFDLEKETLALEILLPNTTPQSSMILITGAVPNGIEAVISQTFRMIPTDRQCPYNEAFYEPATGVLFIISKEKRNDLPKVEDGAEITIEKYYEYHITTSYEIINFIQRFASNHADFNYMQFMK